MLTMKRMKSYNTCNNSKVNLEFSDFYILYMQRRGK